MLTEWVRATMAALATWENGARCRDAFDQIGLIIGEVMVAGVKADPAEVTQGLLPFDVGDAGRMVERGAVTGEESFALFAQLLHDNITALFVARGVEALAAPRHQYHDHVRDGFGAVVTAVVAAGMAERRGALAEFADLVVVRENGAAIAAARERYGALYGAPDVN